MIIRLTYHRLIKKLIISANTIGAVIWTYIWQEHFDPASPSRPDNAYSKSCSKRKRKYWILQRKYTFKFKITPDRHNAKQSLNYYDLPDPRNFSLPSTFKAFITVQNMLPRSSPLAKLFKTPTRVITLAFDLFVQSYRCPCIKLSLATEKDE